MITWTLRTHRMEQHAHLPSRSVSSLKHADDFRYFYTWCIYLNILLRIYPVSWYTIIVHSIIYCLKRRQSDLIIVVQNIMKITIANLTVAHVGRRDSSNCPQAVWCDCLRDCRTGCLQWATQGPPASQTLARHLQPLTQSLNQRSQVIHFNATVTRVLYYSRIC